MSQVVSTIYEGYINIPVKVKDRNGSNLVLLSTSVTHKNGLVVSENPSWFSYSLLQVEEPDGNARIDITYKFLSSATTPGIYTIQYVITNGHTSFTKSFDVDIPSISPGSVNPSSVGGLVYWTTADAVFGLGDESVVSEFINLAPDTISNPVSLVQDDSEFKPTVIKNVIDGHAVLQFDTGDTFRLSKTFGTDKTIFIVFKLNGYGTIFSGSSSTRPRLYSSFGTITSHKTGGIPTTTDYIGIENSNLDTNPGAVNTSVIPYDVSSDYVLVSVVFSAGSAAYWVNGLFSGFTSGSGDATTLFDFMPSASGWLAELAVYNKALTSDDMVDVLTYFSARYPSLSISTDPLFTPSEISTIIADYKSEGADQVINVEEGNIIESHLIVNDAGWGGTLLRGEGTCGGPCTPPGSQPELLLTGLNNGPTYHFNEDEFLKHEGFTGGPTPGDYMTVFLVTRIMGTTTDLDERYIFDGNTVGNRLAFGYVNSKLFVYRGGTRIDSANLFDLNTGHKIVRIEFNPSGANDEVYVNGALAINGDSGGHLMDGITLGARYDSTYGASSTSQFGAEFRIAHMIIYNKILTVDEVYQVENYLAAKYRLPLN